MPRVQVPKTDEWVRLVNEMAEAADDRAMVVLFGAVLDAVLGEMLMSWLLPDKIVQAFFDPLREEAFLSTFGARKNLAFALGLISEEERKDLQAVATVRNIFAHHLLDATFEHPEVRKCLSKLQTVRAITADDSPRDRFRKATNQFLISFRTFRQLEPTTPAKFRRRVERRVANEWKAAVRKHYKRKAGARA
jgi:DNA-binding MltR family transcriptional regulator